MEADRQPLGELAAVPPAPDQPGLTKPFADAIAEAEKQRAEDLAAETDARRLYTEAAEYCDSIHDYVSKELFDDLLKDEEGHIDFLETQQELVRQVGIALYAQKHIGEFDDH